MHYICLVFLKENTQCVFLRKTEYKQSPFLFAMKAPRGTFKSVACSFSEKEHPLAVFLNEAADAHPI